MTPEQIKISSEILGVLVMIVSVFSLNSKRMSLLVILQCIANVLVVCQYAIRGEISSSGVCAIGALETLIIFFFSRKEKSFPIYLTVAFTVISVAFPIASAVERGYFDPVSDLLPIIASVLFNMAMVQNRSSISRILMFCNAFIWLLLNIINPSVSLIITYTVLVSFDIVGIVRLDRGEWRIFFTHLFGKKKSLDEKTQEISEKTEENV